ncbi:hypothetical protein [Nocardioides convexus]|uniref:hypothetical protein n=1 Tax=Nocardioides convexus TaxID=2712224 RepID=UPI002418946E|nr:hypothetical protein [Nocardioides convexus]
MPRLDLGSLIIAPLPDREPARPGGRAVRRGARGAPGDRGGRAGAARLRGAAPR